MDKATFTCECGRKWRVVEEKSPGIIKYSMGIRDYLRRKPRNNRYEESAPWTVADTRVPPSTSNINTTTLQPGERRFSRQYRPKTARDLSLYFAWSITIGVSAGAIAALFNASPKTSMGIASIVFGVLFLVSSMPVVFLGGSNVVQTLEEMTRKDLDGDGKIGKGRVKVPIRLDVTDGKRHKVLDIDITHDLQHFAQAVLDGDVTFSETGAAKFRLRNDRKQEFIAMRNEFLQRTLIAWKNEKSTKSGYYFLHGFERALEEIATYPLSDDG